MTGERGAGDSSTHVLLFLVATTILLCRRGACRVTEYAEEFDIGSFNGRQWRRGYGWVVRVMHYLWTPIHLPTDISTRTIWRETVARCAFADCRRAVGPSIIAQQRRRRATTDQGDDDDVADVAPLPVD